MDNVPVLFACRTAATFSPIGEPVLKAFGKAKHRIGLDGFIMALFKTGICDFGWKARDFEFKGVDGKSYTLADVRGAELRVLYAASSGGLSGFSEMNLASTSPQSAHWKYWIASSRRARCNSTARTFTGLQHFGQGASINNVKDMVNLFRARRTEDTQKGPVRYYEGPGGFAITPLIVRLYRFMSRSFGSRPG